PRRLRGRECRGEDSRRRLGRIHRRGPRPRSVGGCRDVRRVAVGPPHAGRLGSGTGGRRRSVRSRLDRVGGLHADPGALLRRPLRTPHHQHASGSAAVLPGRARRPGCDRPRRQGHRDDVPPRRRGGRHGADHRAVPDRGAGRGRRVIAPRAHPRSRADAARRAALLPRERDAHDRGASRDRVDTRIVTAPQNPSTRAGGTRVVQTPRTIRRALISVYDKTGLEELARGLHDAGVTLVSTGSTAARIAESGVPVTPVEELTGFPETLEGRVKTLHPRVHAGILADTRKPEHVEQIADLGIEAFDLVVVNLYPFTETVASG